MYRTSALYIKYIISHAFLISGELFGTHIPCEHFGFLFSGFFEEIGYKLQNNIHFTLHWTSSLSFSLAFQYPIVGDILGFSISGDHFGTGSFRRTFRKELDVLKNNINLTPH